MHSGSLKRACLAALTVLLVWANGDGGALGAAPSVRISEIHYDNAGTDAGEAIEISGPAGTDLTGWTIVLYNGSNSLTYLPLRTLSGVIPSTCGTRGVVVENYPVNGIQNGDPDGVALVDPTGAVVEFLSYEGTFTAADGPAAGMASVDIGVRETSTTAAGLSLQRNGDGTWNAPAPHTFGACNDADDLPPADVATVSVSPASATVFTGATRAFTASALDSAGNPVAADITWTSSDTAIASIGAAGVATGVAPGTVTITATASNGTSGTATLQVEDVPTPTGPPDVRVTEIHYDNAGTDTNEAIEIEGSAGTNLTGWTVVLYNGNGGGSYNTRTLSGFIPASCDGRGVVVVTYPDNTIQNGHDAIALVDADGRVAEFISYEGSFTATNGPAAGLTAIDILASQNSAPIGRSLQRYADGHWSLQQNTFGICNPAAPPPVPNTIAITGRNGSDAPLPVGFQDQLFASMTNDGGPAIPTTFTWTSETPGIASIDGLGVVTGLAEGTAILRATAADGTTGTIALPVHVAQASPTALYVGNAAFGEPVDADPTDDIIVRYPQFIASFNPARGTSNWVAFEMDPTHFGPQDRCDCFTFDHDLPAALPRYTTADYTGAGAFHGYGIDRGHLVRSFDRTAGSLDNARTFYFSNIVPQASDLNQGPWANLENALGNLVRTGGKEVYVITGVAGSKGTIKDEGKIVIPASTWKVAVIMPRDAGLADVVDYRDLEVIAVNMPNEPGIRSVNWETYKVTVDDIEALTGYDLLALLPDKVENAVESGTKPPFAVADGPYTAAEGSTVTMSAAGSFDTNGTVAGYSWLFGEGSSATGPVVSHTYPQDGTYTVTLVVTDNDGLTDMITTTASVSNVAPAIASIAAGNSLLPGETFTASGSFTDPGADSWTATVDYGDGSSAAPLPLAGQTFALSHLYESAGVFTVAVSVSDGAATAVETTTVTVLSARDAIGLALSAVAGNNSLEVKLSGAVKNIDEGNVSGALGKLRAAMNELEAMVRSGRMSSADAEPIAALLARTIASLSR